jgi:PKD repeat protein
MDFTTFWGRLRTARAGRSRPASQSRTNLAVEALENRALPSATLVAAFNFNEGSGTVVHDLSGNNNNGSLNGPKWTSAGKYGGALSFSGNGDVVTVANSASLHLTSGMTLEAWIDPSSLYGYRTVLEKEATNSESYTLFADDGSGNNPSAYVVSNGNEYGAVSKTAVSTGRWNFVAATYDGKTLSFYVNGKLGASQAVTGSIDVSNGALRIGGNSIWGQYFKGLIDEVRVYNGALTASQIGLDMISALNGPQSPSQGPSSSSSPPVASAGPNKSSSEGQAVTFNGSVTGGTAPYTYSWVFGDGGTATGSLTPTHTYVTDGTYTATLTVSDGQGRSSTSPTTVTVVDTSPTANAGGPYSGTPGTTINFGGTATDPDPTDTLSYSWNFGDGATASGQTASHSYAAAGTYTVTFTASDQEGASKSATATVTVTAPTVAPTANAGPSATTSEGQAVAFSGSVTGGAAPFTYQWTFGDGGTASGTLTPSHTYVTDGSYTATLTVTDGQGRSSSSSTAVVVKDAPPVVNVGGPYSGTPSATVAFSGTATDPDPTDTLSYSWNFGDGTNATGKAASHSYSTGGIYGVTLTVTDQEGATTTAATTVTVSAASAVPTMALPLVKNGAVATNGDGSTYPDEYGGSIGTEGGTATIGVNTANSITGAAVDMHLTAGQLYAEFNPYNYAGNPAYPSPRGWAQDYSANPAQWQDNTYNRMSFWVYVPTTDTAFATDGSQGWEFGTYVKQINNPDLTSDEYGGEHYYHLLNLPNMGTWVQVVINMHPDHRRGDPGSTDPGVVTYPTTSTYGGADPASTYNYFDTLTRFYLQEPYATPSGYPADYLIDGIQFYKDPYQENDTQVYNLTGTYRASDNQLAVTWNRDKAEDTVNQEVRYAFSDIHQLGWANATAAPNGTISPPGGGAYNNMVYDTTGINMAGHSVVYIAIKPQNSDLFTEIAIPLDPTNGGAAAALPTGASGTTSGGKVVQTSAADFNGGTSNGTAVTSTAGGELRLAQQANGFASTGTFISLPLDAGKAVAWGTANWSASLPPGTTVTVYTRTGNSATPDSTWSSWSPVSNDGKVASSAGRYLQYEVVLTTNDAALTATVYDLSFLWS